VTGPGGGAAVALRRRRNGVRGGDPLPSAERERVHAAVIAETQRPPHPDVEALVERLRERFGPAFAGALYYGSCRRQREPDGVFDLHVLVTDLRSALGWAGAALCRALPPNVYYLEIEHGGRVVRCKYAVLSLAQFRRGCSVASFHAYFWARYAQPLTILAAPAPEALVEGLVDAVETLHRRALPRLGDLRLGDPRRSDAPAWRALWVGALRLCYRTELRPEGVERAATLVDAQPEYYRQTGEAVLEDRAAPGRVSVASRVDWAVRIALGKPLSVLRLVKGLYTFDGGIAYVLWKLERHTGLPLEVPERVRRWPLLFAWPLLWRLWRRRVIR
jgi:hypothetical protein